MDRRREIAEVRRRLSATQLLTLTGVGGVGKTRLALRVAARVRRAFADGVWLVELAALEDRTLLEQTVADTVGLRDQSARSPREVVVGYLRDKQLLLVLDNCEHLADRCAGLAVELLTAAPGLRILATSRHALRTAGEHILAVPPLPVPDPEPPPQPGELVGDEAIRLFAERAVAVRPGFEVTAGNRATIARICRRLDGLPLAIELAAARLRALSPEQILHRLDDRFRFLRVGSRAGPARHQTLRAVVDWSYQLCSPAEQTLWARMSMFAGGFDLDAAEAVCGGDNIDRDRVLDLVAGLVDKSILIREAPDRVPRARYRLLDTIAHYGREALHAAGAEAVLRRRHRDYYLDLAERGNIEWFGPTQPKVAARTRREHANLRLALEYSLTTTGESQAGLRLAAALHFYWHCGFVAEGRHWLDRALTQDAAASGLRVLATSRQALGTAGEYLLEVPPLPVPGPGQPLTPRALARGEAVRLFAERAALAWPGFTVNAGNRAAIVRICQRLDGIPLAIELAALRVRAMPVTKILTGLDDYLAFLATGSRVAVPRVQTLRAAIDWSFALCSGQEQQLWARASVFAGGFDLDVAEAVCSGTGIARDDVFDLVAALVDKSVLTRTNHDTPARYRMLETIRHYGQEQLAASGQQTVVRARHRDHYRRLATQVEQEWLGPNELTWFTRLRREHPNLRAALEFCLTEPGQARAGLEITAALFHYWVRSGTHTEGRYWFDRALELAPEPSPHRAKALWVSGYVALLQADLATARSLLDECRVLARRLGDELALAHTTLGFGVAAFYQNDLQNAVTLLEDALAHHQVLGDQSGVWLALCYLALAAAALGDPDRAVAFSEECLALCDGRGASSSRIYPLWALSLARWLSGDRQSAGRLIRDGLPAAHHIGDRWILAHYLEALAWITGADGRHARAARLLGAAHTIWRSTGTPQSGPGHLAPFHDHCEHHLRTALGDEQFTTAFQHGIRFTPDQAIDYALETNEPTTAAQPTPTPPPHDRWPP